MGEFAPVVGCLCHGALSEWHLGEIASCKANMDEAISLARELNDKNALALALNWAAMLGGCERNPAEVDRWASELIGAAVIEMAAGDTTVGPTPYDNVPCT
jgi:hypothetical protein